MVGNTASPNAWPTLLTGRTTVPSRTRCLMVMYHYVRPLPDPDLPFFKAMTPERFQRQIEELGKEWTFVSLDDYIEGLRGSRDIPSQCCILTFDDGLRDHYEFAFPILRRLGVPGAFFVSTLPVIEACMLNVHMIQHLVARLAPQELAGRLSRAVRAVAPGEADRLLSPDPATVDRVYAYEAEPPTRWAKYVMNFVLQEALQGEVTLRLFREEFGPERDFARRFYLSTGQVREMGDNGMTFGSHGHRHLAMSACDGARKREELRQSRRLLESWLGRPVTSFCFPWGGAHHIDEESEELLAAEGFRCALTTLDGINEGEVSPFYLRRRDCIRVPEGS